MVETSVLELEAIEEALSLFKGCLCSPQQTNFLKHWLIGVVKITLAILFLRGWKEFYGHHFDFQVGRHAQR